MRMYEYKIKDLEDIHGTPRGFFESEVCIIDNEISNDISADWDYEKAKIICTGFLRADTLFIYIAEKDNDEDFKRAVITEIENTKLDFELVAFNRNMEIGNFKGHFDYEIKMGEVKPFSGHGWSKDRFFKTLIEKKVIPKVVINDPFNGDGGLCIDRWQKYLKDHNPQHLMDIVNHNMNCLLKECVIFKHRQYFRDNYRFDDRGFVVGEK